jgi:MFS family permease
MIWMPAYLAKQLGFGLTKSAMWTTVTILGMMAGIWFGQLADRIGRKPAFILFQAGAAVSIVFYAQLTDPLTMLWAGALLGMFVNGMLGGYGALISEAYPTAAHNRPKRII